MMENISKILLVILATLSIGACGGGGGSGSGDRPSTEETTSADYSFAVELQSIDVRQVSTGDTIPADLSDISSGELTLHGE